MQKTEQKKKGNELVITRTFNAPTGLLWKAFTDPGYLKRWWGPKGYTTPVAKVDLRVGGKNLYCMRSPTGQDIWGTGTFREIVPNRKLVVTDSFSDEKGNIVPASRYGMSGDFPLEMLWTLTFEEVKGRTKFTLRHEGLPPGEMTESTRNGWNESFDKLDLMLEEETKRREKLTIVAEPGTPVASLVRVFDAPPDRLFQAFTDPKLIPKWWGPARLKTTVDHMDARTGGSWRFIHRDAEGTYTFRGVYHEVSPTRIVQTFEYEGMPGHVMLQIVTFEDLGGKTKMTEKSILESADDMKGMLDTGMVEGWTESIDRLARLVENT